MSKSVVVTIRFNRDEMRELSRYLRHNAYFDSLSRLGRVATMEFVRSRAALPLQRSLGQAGGKQPWFLWDYDLTEVQVQELLTHAPFEQRKWLLGRMLERLGPSEIVRYVSIETLRQALDALFAEPLFARSFYLTGGTALAAFYRSLRRLILASLKPPAA